MRRALALAAIITVAAAATTAAAADAWKKYADGENGTEWSYNTGYSYKDKATGRVVVMKAISKPSANIAPSGPGTGVGFVEAIDCAKSNVLLVGSYKPGADLAQVADWRNGTPKKAEAELVAAVCPTAGQLPSK